MHLNSHVCLCLRDRAAERRQDSNPEYADVPQILASLQIPSSG